MEQESAEDETFRDSVPDWLQTGCKFMEWPTQYGTVPQVLTGERLQPISGMLAPVSAFFPVRVQGFSQSERLDNSFIDWLRANAAALAFSANASANSAATDLKASTGIDANPSDNSSRTAPQLSGDSILVVQKSIVANGTAEDRSAETREDEQARAGQ